MFDYDIWLFGLFFVSIVNVILNNCKCLVLKLFVLKVIMIKYKIKLFWVIKNMYSIKIWLYSIYGFKS